MSNKKFLRQFYHKQRQKPLITYKSVLPKIEYDFITSNPLYNTEKKNFINSGPKIWLMNLIYHKGPLKTKEIYQYYLDDKNAQEENFFKSFTDLRLNFVNVFFKEKLIYSAPFNRKNEKFKGFFVDEKKGLKDIDPQILMGFVPVPKFFALNKYLWARDNKEDSEEK